MRPSVNSAFLCSQPSAGNSSSSLSVDRAQMVPRPSCHKTTAHTVKGGRGGWNLTVPLPAAPVPHRMPPPSPLLRCRKKTLHAWEKLLEGPDLPCRAGSPLRGRWHPDGTPCAVGLIIRHPQGCSGAGGGDVHLPSDLLKLRPSFMGAIKVIF